MSSYTNTLARYPISDNWAEHIARGSGGGIDYAVGMNTPIPAPCDGRLENRPITNGYGNYIRFHHGDGFIDEYLHLRDGGFVTEGNYKQGDIIGYSGSTGQSTGPHIHWHLIDPSGRRVNPLRYVDGGTGGADPEIKNIQELLNKNGYSLVVDGISGPKTLAAIKDFQGKRGLVVDGIVGPKTLAALQVPVGPPSVAGATEVQELLNKFGYNLVVDGSIGPKTKAAIRDFQISHGLSVDGIAGPLTTAALRKGPEKPTPPPVVAPPVVAPVTPSAKPVVKPVTKPVSKPVKPAEPAKPSKPVRPVKIKDVQPVFAAIPTQKGVIVRGGLFGVVRSLAFWNDTLTRAFNTFLQVALAAVGTGAVGITDIDYIGILNLAAGGAIVSVLTSFVRATTPKK
jgi:peptidoglycan hydrolase-like protein with peptidoglycan-binding domain